MNGMSNTNLNKVCFIMYEFSFRSFTSIGSTAYPANASAPVRLSGNSLSFCPGLATMDECKYNQNPEQTIIRMINCRIPPELFSSTSRGLRLRLDKLIQHPASPATSFHRESCQPVLHSAPRDAPRTGKNGDSPTR